MYHKHRSLKFRVLRGVRSHLNSILLSPSFHYPRCFNFQFYPKSRALPNGIVVSWGTTYRWEECSSENCLQTNAVMECESPGNRHTHTELPSPRPTQPKPELGSCSETQRFTTRFIEPVLLRGTPVFQKYPSILYASLNRRAVNLNTSWERRGSSRINWARERAPGSSEAGLEYPEAFVERGLNIQVLF